MPSTSTTRTVTGLTNGTAYQFRVAATNALGTGAYSTASAAVAPSAPEADPFFSNVVLLLPFNGNLTDFSSNPKTMTAFGDAAATGAAKFGSASLVLDGAGDYLTTPSSADFSLPGDFVIEMWFRPTAHPDINTLEAQLIGHASEDQSGSLGWRVALVGNSGGYTGVRLWSHRNPDNAASVQRDRAVTIPMNEWHHLAIARSGTSLAFYLNGSRLGDAFTSSLTAEHMTPSNPTPLFIGRLNRPGWATNNFDYFPGQIDDLRITKGSARGYTGETITVPTAAFPAY